MQKIVEAKASSETFSIHTGVKHGYVFVPHLIFFAQFLKHAFVLATKRIYSPGKMTVFSVFACVISTLLYGSNSWTTDTRLNTFILRNVHRMDKVSTALTLVSTFPVCLLYSLDNADYDSHDTSRLWNIAALFTEDMASGTRTIGCPKLRYKDVCKMDMQTFHLDSEKCKSLAADHTRLRSTLAKHLESGEENLLNKADKRAHRKERGQSTISIPRDPTQLCPLS